MTALLDERVTLVDGIAFADSATTSDYRDRWEREASEDHVRSAIANAPSDSPIENLLTAKVAPLWSRFARNRHVGALLDVGAGYGRDVDLDVIRGWWSLRSLVAIRWLAEHGFDPSAPGCEVDVLRSRM